MRLDDIGFYTLSENRAKTSSDISPIFRAEIILTDRCNLKCPYCRGIKKGFTGDMSLPFGKYIIQTLGEYDLRNIRFSGGEPTLYPYLEDLVEASKKIGVERIAISTNGTAPLDFYKHLIKIGVNDFSISLDAGCCSIGKVMTGGNSWAWSKASETIKELSKLTYVTVGMVFNESNINHVEESIKWVDSLNPKDIRIIPSAQYNKAIKKISDLPFQLIGKYPILRYRVSNLVDKIPFRGISKQDSKKCYLVLDDLAILGNYQFPCIIYLREQGNPIGKFDEDFRKKRLDWFHEHNVSKDKICSKNCLDVCRDHNNRCKYYATTNARNQF